VSAAPVRIVGIDPGLAATGFGVVDQAGNSFRLIEFGVLTTSPGEVLARRLAVLRDGLAELLERHSPREAAVEQLFFNVNVRTALAVGQARGVVLLALADAGLPVSEYTPSQVKQTVVGYGSADKKQVQYMVRTILAMRETPKPDDAADALAIAICHAHSRTLSRLGEVST
jgi:crossover junction endodeoxyribonuclease RuvC